MSNKLKSIKMKQFINFNGHLVNMSQVILARRAEYGDTPVIVLYHTGNRQTSHGYKSAEERDAAFAVLMDNFAELSI